MAFLSIPHVRVAGMAAVVPERVYSNYDYDFIPEKDRNILVESTGINERRFVEPGNTTSDLGIYASDKLLQEMNWDKAGIDLLVFVSQSRDYLLPNTACIIQNRLGLSKNCMAFDVPLGCSGYTYGLSVASSLMMNGHIRRGLLIVGDVSTYELSYKDKSVFPLFGDAVSVTALEFAPDSEDSMQFNLQTDGSGYEAIIIPDGGIRNIIRPESLELKQYDEGVWRTRRHLFLDGMKIFEFTIREVARNIRQLLAQTGETQEQFDYFVFHQANLLMNETVRKQLKLPPEKVPYTLGKFGNTSSASIPLTLVSELGEQLRSRSARYMLSGFGVGLSWGAAAVRIGPIVCPPVYEYGINQKI